MRLPHYMLLLFFRNLELPSSTTLTPRHITGERDIKLSQLRHARCQKCFVGTGSNHNENPETRRLDEQDQRDQRGDSSSK